MNTAIKDRATAKLPRWADVFPYVNGGLFSGSTDVPRFSRIARSYLLHIGSLDWTKINPDIFGSMIQAVADDEERGALGMNYTSVPNILKVLNPLFLDDLRAQLNAAGDNKRKLKNLRDRIAKIRVFDPACGSGNFLVIAYKEMREIEARINDFRGESGRRSNIRLTNFLGIELRDFPAEIARLALIIAEYQSDVAYRGQQEALVQFLPLDAKNWITCGNALRIDWLTICPPTGRGVKKQEDSDGEIEAGETYICGNPPYKGTKNQTKSEKEDLKVVFEGQTTRTGTLDYVCGWFMKAAEYSKTTPASFAFVSTNSICQGGQVPVLWPILFSFGLEISFVYLFFKWKNLASHNAGVIVVIVGMSTDHKGDRLLFVEGPSEEKVSHKVSLIGPYLVPGNDTIVQRQSDSISGLEVMSLGNAPYDGGNLILEAGEVSSLDLTESQRKRWIRLLFGSSEIIKSNPRRCLWIENEDLEEACLIPKIADRIEAVRKMRLESKDLGTQAMAGRPHQFREMYSAQKYTIAVPLVSSENRDFLTPDVISQPCSMTNKSYAIYDGEIFNIAILSSRLHLSWIGAVCGRMKTDYSYSNKMGWNTFPVPKLTEKNKEDLTPLRRGHPSRARGTFPRDHCRSLRPREDARRPARRP